MSKPVAVHFNTAKDGNDVWVFADKVAAVVAIPVKDGKLSSQIVLEFNGRVNVEGSAAHTVLKLLRAHEVINGDEGSDPAYVAGVDGATA